MTLTADDHNGHAIASTGAASDSNLTPALSYTPFLGVGSTTSPNGASTSLTYDANGRLATGVSATAASTAYTYFFGTTATGSGSIGNGAYTATATTNGHWSTMIADGLGGRPRKPLVTGQPRRGLERVGWMFTMAAVAYNLVRMRNLQAATT